MNTLYTQFQDALKRESKTITTYYANVDYKVLFRKPKEKNTSTDITGTIFYDASIPLYQGQLITFSGEQYILMNKLPVDGDVYFKSTMLKCNVIFKGVPCHAYKLSLGLDQGTVISTIDGNGELITEHTTEVENFTIGSTAYNIMNRWFEIINSYNISGLSHIFLKVTVAPPDNFTLDITSNESTLEVGATSQITSVCANNGTAITGQTVTYGSSDTAIVTVDANGLVTAIGNGTATITATWVEKSITDTLSYTITSTPSETYTIELTASGDFIVGGTARTVYATLKDGTGTVVPTWTAVWTVNYNGMATGDFTITYVENNIKVQIAENYDIIGNHFFLTCKTSDDLATATFDATISV